MEESNVPGSSLRQIVRLSKEGKKNELQDSLAIESPLEISLKHFTSGEEETATISITMRTPGQDDLLALGFLFTEGILSHLAKEVEVKTTAENSVTIYIDPSEKVNLDKLERHFYTSSSCGVCGKSSLEAVETHSIFDINHHHLTIESDLLWQLKDRLLAEQSLFSKTGGIHGAGLFDQKGNLVKLFEDVGRHNALDKLIGYAFREQLLPLANHFVLLSGRASFELIQKGAMAGVPLMVAVGAPSTLAVDLASEKGMGLVGFLKDKTCNIYCGAHRLLT